MNGSMSDARDKHQGEEQRQRALIALAVLALMAVLFFWPEL